MEPEETRTIEDAIVLIGIAIIGVLMYEVSPEVLKAEVRERVKIAEREKPSC